MKITIAALGLVFGASSALEARLQLAFDETPCLAPHLSQLDLGEFCTGARIRNKIKKLYDTHGATCEWNFNYEMNLITRTLSNTKSIQVLQELCDTAEAKVWATAPQTEWTGIDPQFTPEFMDEYTIGGTFLNEETGNFRNRDGTDPTANQFYATDEASFLAGQKIDAFYKDGAKTSVLGAIDHLDQCENQAIMCCFGRDRQYRDGNGDCARTDCDDANPGDNSNLCYLDSETGPTAYPGDEEIHCHGMAWSGDMSDANSRLRFNTFFFVLMHDHMYSRGYVSPAVPGASMCGCIEDMSPVSRADCSEADMDVNYYFSYDAVSGASTVEPEDLEFRFRACRGLTPDPDNAGEMKGENNDLASYAYKLVKDGKMSVETRDNIFNVLVGHDEPNNNTNEEACAAAWSDATDGAPYSARRELRGRK